METILHIVANYLENTSRNLVELNIQNNISDENKKEEYLSILRNIYYFSVFLKNI